MDGRSSRPSKYVTKGNDEINHHKAMNPLTLRADDSCEPPTDEGDGDVWRDEIRTRFGGVMYLSAGARLFTFDCLYTIQPERESIFNSQPEMIFGGDILMEGGSLTVVACSFFAIVPGFINSLSTEIGGSVLILGGTATFTLVNFMTSQIWAYNIGVGMHLALLGGAVNMAGTRRIPCLLVID
jgi:hypothetical protein